MLYTVSHKKVPTNFCPYPCQILTGFKYYFISALHGKFAMTTFRNIPADVNCVATLPCEI